MEHFIQPVASFFIFFFLLKSINVVQQYKCNTKIPLLYSSNVTDELSLQNIAVSRCNLPRKDVMLKASAYSSLCAHSMWAMCPCTCGWVYVRVCVYVCVCPCGCCTINSELRPEHITADQRRLRSMLLIECTGQCACASRHLWAEPMLVRKCQLSSPHRELKTSPHFLVSLWGVVMCVCEREGERQSKPVWSDKLGFNWLWWGYRGYIRRETDKKQRWFPFLLGPFTVLTERSVDRPGGTCHFEPQQKTAPASLN